MTLNGAAGELPHTIITVFVVSPQIPPRLLPPTIPFCSSSLTRPHFQPLCSPWTRIGPLMPLQVNLHQTRLLSTDMKGP